MYRGQSFKVRKISEENKDPSDGIVIHEKKVFPTPEDFDKYQKRRESNNKAARNSRARKMQATQAIITDLEQKLKAAEEENTRIKNEKGYEHYHTIIEKLKAENEKLTEEVKYYKTLSFQSTWPEYQQPVHIIEICYNEAVHI